MAPHSSTLAWKIPRTEEPGRLQSMGSLRDTTEQLHFHFSLSYIGEGNGNPLQCSCLENSRDGGAWWAAVYGVAQSRTRLKRLSSSSSEVYSSVMLWSQATVTVFMWKYDWASVNFQNLYFKYIIYICFNHDYIQGRWMTLTHTNNWNQWKKVKQDPYS